MLTLTVDEPNDNSVFEHKCFVNFRTQHPVAQQVGAAQQKNAKRHKHTRTHPHAHTYRRNRNAVSPLVWIAQSPPTPFVMF